MDDRNKRRYILADSGQRMQPDWVYKIDAQTAEFLKNGGVIEQIPIGASAYKHKMLTKDRAVFCVHPSPTKKSAPVAVDL